jgi:hypothetical protein
MIKHFMLGGFRCKRLTEAIISKNVKRYLDKSEIPLYYKYIFISQL